MKKVLLTLVAMVAICLSSCEKEALPKPEAPTLPAEKPILCHQCGASWDIVNPDEDDSTGNN